MNAWHIVVILVFILSLSNFANGGQQRCKAPTKIIQNGKRTSLNVNYFKIGSIVRYWCDSGYHIKGSKYLKCILRNSRAAWAGIRPTCVANSNQQQPATNSRTHSNSNSLSDSDGVQSASSTTRCSKHDVTNGWMKINYYKQRRISLGFYYCKRGWKLVGKSRRVCLKNGVWLGSPPVCKPQTVKDCGDPGSPRNGGRHLSMTTKGSIVKFYCKDQYKLFGCSKRICTNKGWSGSVPVCKPILCPRLGNPKYGSVNVSGLSVLSTATYTCNKGLKLYGDSVRRCRGTEGWTGRRPVCKCYACDYLSNPLNGYIKLFGNKRPGTKAEYYCKEDYTLSGNRQRFCLSTCSWSGEDPICKKTFTKCGSLQSPTNGQVIISSTKIGSIATYRCNNGYRIFGYDRRECLDNGVWSMEPPTCQAVSCSSLEPPVNGGVTLTGAAFGSVAVYYCFTGYKLLGDDKQYCQQNGVWSGIPPKCQAVDCGKLQSPLNGNVDYEDTVFKSVATYSCQNGFEISGDKTRSCDENGTWLGTIPSCKPIECDDLDDLANGEVIYNSTVYRSVATYSCQYGYKLVGVSVRICRENGQWSGEKPVCEITDCGNLIAPVNGFVDFKGTVFESIASYTCQEGYDLVGDDTRLCEENGRWSGDMPTCEGVDCGSLTAPLNGFIDIEETTLGSVVSYSCQRGYILSNDESRVCQSTGVWSGEEPICEGLEGGDCGALPNPIGGAVVVSGTSVGSSADYTCDEGYKLTRGDKIRYCQDNQHWSGEEAVCEVILCPILEDPKNGHVSFQNVTFGSEAFYFCDKNYRIRFIVRTCGSDGQWTGEEPLCELINCGPLNNPSNGFVNFQSSTFFSIAQYTCKQGFELMGNSERECMANGEWSGHDPICSGSEMCSTLSDPDNGIVITDKMNMKGSIATYVCDFGYMLVGNRQRLCQGTLSDWNGTAPICQPIMCSLLSNPPNGIVSFDERSVFFMATYSCNNGFFLVGSEIRECKETGLWSEIEPTCQEMTGCDVLSDIRYGSVQYNNTLEGTIASYSCQTGYTVSDTAHRLCQDNGQWSGAEAVCDPIDCGSLTNPDNGEVIQTGTRFGDIASYVCDDGHTIVGEKMRYCQANGEWAGNEPFCTVVEVKDKCNDPGVPINGDRTGNDFTVGSILYYRCNDGFMIMGSKIRICQENGLFNGMQPTCEPINDECQGSSTIIFDECNRLCECVNRKVVKCSRLRRDWIEMNQEDKLRYVNTVKTLATDELYKPRYEALVKEYEESYETDAQMVQPSVSQFIPYNRYFMLRYENLLREIDCRITIPYWDWTAFPVKPYDNPVWDNELGFGNSSRATDKCITTGPFKLDEFSIPESAGLSDESTCIHRDYKEMEFPRRDSIERDILPLPAADFNTVHTQLQIFKGVTVLCIVGGDLCTNRAAWDPVYLLHISHIDFIFDRWQRFGEGRQTVRYGADVKPLVFGEGLVVSSLTSNTFLPGGVAVLYSAPIFHKNHAPPFLQFI